LLALIKTLKKKMACRLCLILKDKHLAKARFVNVLILNLKEYEKLEKSAKEIADYAFSLYSDPYTNKEIQLLNSSRSSSKLKLPAIQALTINDFYDHLEGCMYSPQMFLARSYETYKNYSLSCTNRIKEVQREIDFLQGKSKKLFNRANNIVEVVHSSNVISSDENEDEESDHQPDDRNAIQRGIEATADEEVEEEEEMDEETMTRLMLERYKVKREVIDLEERETDLIKKQTMVVNQMLRIQSFRNKKG
jgi:hypothetical protein